MSEPYMNRPLSPGRKMESPNKTKDKKLKTTKVKDEISEKGRTIDGNRPDQIIINPVQEAVEKRAVFAYGRFNPPTTGHEKLIHKVESVAKEQGAQAHIVASHSEGKSKDPLPKEKKVEYLKKVAAKGTHVSHSTSEHPTLLHQLSKLHKSGVEHVTLVSDKEKEFGDLVHKYNGVEGRHGHFNFKTIKSVSSGMRDPDAEGTEGISGTKMRAHARSGNMEEFKKGLPTALHKHAEEIAKHIRSVKEDIDEEFEDFLDESISMASRLKKASSMRRYEAKLQAARKRSMMRRAGTKVITQRATKLAIGKMKTRFAGGRDPSTLSAMEKQRIEDIVHKRKQAVRRLAMRLIPTVRKTEAQRLMKHIHVQEETYTVDMDLMNELYDVALEEVNSVGAGGFRGMGNVTGNVGMEGSPVNNYTLFNADNADTRSDELKKIKKMFHDKHHASKAVKEELEENFMDGKNPEDKGDMARHGLKGKSISQLKKIRSSDDASPRKKQLAHWYINMHKEEIDRANTHARDEGTSSLVDIYAKDTPGQGKKQVKEDTDRTAFVYMAPQPPKEIFAQCGSCAHFMPESQRCTLFGKDDKVVAEASCTLYAHGVPSDEQEILESTTPKEAGYVTGKVRCENCSWFDEEKSTCGLFQSLNKKMKDTFKLQEKVDKYGCCNGFYRKEEEMSEDINVLFQEAVKATDKEAIPRSGQPRKSIDYVVRSQVNRFVSDKPYRQQALQKQKIDEEVIEEEKPVWEKEPPKDGGSKLSPAAKAKAKARAKAAGRPYPNLVDNMWAAKNEEVEDEGCPLLDEDYEEELHEYIEEDFIPTGTELYESWGELTEEAVKNGKRVQLNKPFLTPGGPKKRAVYVRHPETGNIVKVGFGDPNMRIKKSNPERRKSFRARHNCENPGPKHKARYWSCKAW